MKSKALLFLLLPLIGHAQNLVPNGSFEEYVNCPDGLPDMECTHWLSSLGTPDYFNACSLDGIGVPNNAAGNQEAFEGNAYCGVVTFVKSQEYRELISVELINPLLTNTLYYFSLRICRSNKQVFDMASNNIGIKLTNQLFANQPEWIDNTSLFACDTIVTDSVNWTLLKGHFVAEAPYSILTIGNFYTDLNTLTQESYEPLDYLAYYFIDDVRLSTDSVIGWPALHNEMYNSELGSLIFVNGSLEYKSSKRGAYHIYSNIGQLCQEGLIGRQENHIELNMLSKGIYFFLFMNVDGNKQILKFLKL